MSNIEYYICQRFMTKDFPNYSKNNKIKFEEIISADCGLFPHDERIRFHEKSVLAENEQVIAICMLEKDGEIPTLNGFEFCGYDLVETQTTISALTNCPHLFDFISEHVNLNRYGLIDKISDAEKLQTLLTKAYPDDCHADCDIYCIWRKL